MSVLFDCTTDSIGLHLKNIFASGELKKESVTEIISATVSDGKNYLKESELDDMGHLVNALLDLAETDFEKYRVIQDRLFQSDFDRLMNGDDLLELLQADK